jgi:hypothetical protein
MQSLVKYLIALLFALLFHLLPGQFSDEFSGQFPDPDSFSLPKAICSEDLRLASRQDFGSNPPVSWEARQYNYKENYG